MSLLRVALLVLAGGVLFAFVAAGFAGSDPEVGPFPSGGGCSGDCVSVVAP